MPYVVMLDVESLWTEPLAVHVARVEVRTYGLPGEVILSSTTIADRRNRLC